MLYCHYQHGTLNVAAMTGLPSVPFNITKFQFSTDRYYGNTISGKSGWDAFNNIKNNLIKQIPASNRDYEPKTKIWSVHAKYFDILKQLIDHTYNYKVEFLQHDDLEEFLTGASKRDKKDAPKAEDFFYNYGQPVSAPVLTLDDIQNKLIAMLDEADWPNLTLTNKVKIYRKAAMKWHPDRNNGDGTKMVELNYLWQTYKEMTKI